MQVSEKHYFRHVGGHPSWWNGQPGSAVFKQYRIDVWWIWFWEKVFFHLGFCHFYVTDEWRSADWYICFSCAAWKETNDLWHCFTAGIAPVVLLETWFSVQWYNRYLVHIHEWTLFYFVPCSCPVRLTPNVLATLCFHCLVFYCLHVLIDICSAMRNDVWTLWLLGI